MRLRRRLAAASWTLSQAGQDCWIFGEAFNEKVEGYFVDIGAHDGVSISNTFLLEKRYKWSGLCIEANPLTYELLKQRRAATCLNVCLDSKEGEVDFVLRDVLGGIISSELDNATAMPRDGVVRLKTVPLVNVLRDNAAPRVIDYLSIDIEGAEERVLADFAFDEFIFNCITIERPSARLRDIFRQSGYLLVKVNWSPKNGRHGVW